MKAAIEKLIELAEDNDDFASKLESGEYATTNTPPRRIESLVATYRYWSQCLYTAAWLLTHEEKRV